MGGNRPKEKQDSHQHADVFLAYQPELRRYLCSRLGNQSDAQDLTQEAYLRLSRVKKQNLIKNPESYLFKIANNLANELLIERTKSSKFVKRELSESSDIDDDSVEDSLQRQERVARLEAILDQLPALYRAVLIMRKRDGYSHTEIAELLNISKHTVHTYLKRAVLQCRSLWSEYE